MSTSGKPLQDRLAAYRKVDIYHSAPDKWQVLLNGRDWSVIRPTIDEALDAAEAREYNR